MARTGSTQHGESSRRREETAGSRPARPSGLERALYLTVVLDTGIALLQLYVHRQLLGSEGTYTSFCNVNAQVNCDAVLGSRYASLLGIPLEVLALGKDLALVGLLRWRHTQPEQARRASLLLLGLTLWSAAFAAYLALIATAVLGAVCLLCLGMYILNPLQAVLGWRLARRDAGTAPVLSMRRAALGGTIIAAGIAAVAAIQLPRGTAPLEPVDPDLADWYTSRPIADGLPPARHSKGPRDAPVTIVEFSDFECVYCARAFRDLRALQRRNPARVRIVFHHFPLNSDCNPYVTGRMHRFACVAATAAECAARFGKFWAYHDTLFAAQDHLGRDALITDAVALGIDRGAFVTCLDDPATRAHIRADVTAAHGLGVESTPTLFINGRSVPGALDAGAYQQILAMELRS